uniref:Uncharacterized protein n=1 Tax=Astyanax mexicanus TaxID=7994 RepID=A0A3B1J0P7_ASTMX
LLIQAQHDLHSSKKGSLRTFLLMHWIWNTTANHTHSHFTVFYKILPKCLESTFSSHLHLHNLPLIQEIQ